ncbi:MAG: ABC transporter ATP-binding protein [Planctomycetes bacterium]|nr:ABC transporter ATP-binding protein [Planctomycetota bacterium]
MPSRIELVHVCRTYEMGASRVEALHDLSLVVEPGEFVALMGPSGCGKTTLLNLIGGMDRPSAGEVRVGGEAIHLYSDAQLTSFRRDRVGFVFQFFNLLTALNVQENVELPLLLGNGHDGSVSARAREALEEVGLASRFLHHPYQLSGGEMQRVAIARALVHHPEIILADEPTGNLDSGNGERVLGLLKGLCRRRGVTVLMATHSREAAAFAGRTVRLHDGRVGE